MLNKFFLILLIIFGAFPLCIPAHDIPISPNHTAQEDNPQEEQPHLSHKEGGRVKFLKDISFDIVVNDKDNLFLGKVMDGFEHQQSTTEIVVFILQRLLDPYSLAKHISGTGNTTNTPYYNKGVLTQDASTSYLENALQSPCTEKSTYQDQTTLRRHLINLNKQQGHLNKAEALSVAYKTIQENLYYSQSLNYAIGEHL